MSLPRTENRVIDRFAGIGEIVFPDGTRLVASYDVAVWGEYAIGYLLRHSIVAKISKERNPFFAMNHVGKNFILEMNEGKRISLTIVRADGKAIYVGGVAEGFLGVKSPGVSPAAED